MLIFSDSSLPEMEDNKAFSSDGWLHNLSKILNIHSIYVATLLVLLILLALALTSAGIFCLYQLRKRCINNSLPIPSDDEAHLISRNEVTAYIGTNQ